MDVKDKSVYEDIWSPRRAECPLLISLHKSGSTWVFSYIHKHYRKMGIVMPPNNIYSEFFVSPQFKQNGNFIKNQFIKRSAEERFELLELLRKFGLELATKAHVPEIIDVWPRFKKFYEGYNIIVLKRRYIWPHYLNILFMYCVQQAIGTEGALKHKEKEADGYTDIAPSKVHPDNGIAEDVLKATIQEYGVQFKHHDEVLERFTRNIRFLNDVVVEEVGPEVIYTEDITTDWLEERFKVKVTKTPEPFKTLDFATYFKPDDLSIVHNKIYERFDNEFKYMGYEFQ